MNTIDAMNEQELLTLTDAELDRAIALQYKTYPMKILHSLPATLPELAIILGMDTRAGRAIINTTLCRLRSKGLVEKSKRAGIRYSDRGGFPHIWIRRSKP